MNAVIISRLTVIRWASLLLQLIVERPVTHVMSCNTNRNSPSPAWTTPYNGNHSKLV